MPLYAQACNATFSARLDKIVHCATRENKCFSRVAHDFFSTIGSENGFDLKSGFYQIPLGEYLKKYTAFPRQGPENAHTTFQRMMDNALRGLTGKQCFVYLDDIVVFESTSEEHNNNLVNLFDGLRNTGLKL